MDLLGRYVLVGVCHPSEQVGECGQMTGAIGVEMIEGVEGLTQGRNFRRREALNAEP